MRSLLFSRSFVLATPVLALVAFGCAIDGSAPTEELSSESSRTPRQPTPAPSTTLDSSAPEEASAPSSRPDDGGEPRTATPPSGPPDAEADAGLDASSSVAQDAFSAAPDSGTTVAPVGPGDIAITEIMFDPDGIEPDGEWVEIYNRASSPRSLRGLELRDGAARKHVIASDVIVAPAAYVVLARSRAAVRGQGVPDGDIVYDYSAGLGSSAGILLSNGSSGSIALFFGTTEIARVPYGSFALASGTGKSLELRAGAFPSVAQASHFCVASSAFGTGSFGTPGRASSCP